MSESKGELIGKDTLPKPTKIDNESYIISKGSNMNSIERLKVQKGGGRISDEKLIQRQRF
jgi:hypothetical protein